MAGKRRSPTSTLVSKNSIQKASTALVDLPEKPKEIWSLREAIDALKDQISLALDRGYTYPEISQMLTQGGVEISASTLKYYLSSVKRASDPTAKTRRRRRTLSNRLNLDDLSLDMDTPEEETPEAVKVPAKRGRKPKAVSEIAPPAVVKVPGKRGRKSAATKAAEAAAAASVTAETEAPVRKKPGRKPKSESAAAAPVVKAKGKVGRPAKAAKVGRPATKGKVGRPPKAAAAAPKVAKAPRVAKAAKVTKATPKATVKGIRGRKKAI